MHLQFSSLNLHISHLAIVASLKLLEISKLVESLVQIDSGAVRQKLLKLHQRRKFSTGGGFSLLINGWCNTLIGIQKVRLKRNENVYVLFHLLRSLSKVCWLERFCPALVKNHAGMVEIKSLINLW